MTVLRITELRPKNNFNGFVWLEQLTFDDEVNQLVGTNHLQHLLQDKDLEEKTSD